MHTNVRICSVRHQLGIRWIIRTPLAHGGEHRVQMRYHLHVKLSIFCTSITNTLLTFKAQQFRDSTCLCPSRWTMPWSSSLLLQRLLPSGGGPSTCMMPRSTRDCTWLHSEPLPHSCLYTHLGGAAKSQWHRGQELPAVMMWGGCSQGDCPSVCPSSLGSMTEEDDLACRVLSPFIVKLCRLGAPMSGTEAHSGDPSVRITSLSADSMPQWLDSSDDSLSTDG